MLYFVLTTLTLLFAGLAAIDPDLLLYADSIDAGGIEGIIACNNDLRSFLDAMIQQSSSLDSARQSHDGLAARRSKQLASRRSKQRKYNKALSPSRSRHSSSGSKQQFEDKAHSSSGSKQRKSKQFEDKAHELLRRLQTIDETAYKVLAQVYNDFIEKMNTQSSLKTFATDAKSAMLKVENHLLAYDLEKRLAEYKDQAALCNGLDPDVDDVKLPDDFNNIYPVLNDYYDNYARKDFVGLQPLEAKKAVLITASAKMKQLEQIYALQQRLSETPIVTGSEPAKADLLLKIRNSIEAMYLHNYDPAKFKEVKEDLEKVFNWKVA